jgi:hypothetical protein
MRCERVLHLGGAGFENIEQVAVPALEILKHLIQQPRGVLGVEPKHPVDNMIGADLVRRVEVSRLSRRLEGPDDDPGRIRAQIKALAVQEFGLGQRCSLGAIAVDSRRCRSMTISTWVSSGSQQQ